MSTTPARARRADRVLLACAIGEGQGGVQVMFRDLATWLQRTGRYVHLLYPAPLRQLRLATTRNAAGEDASYCPMPALVRNSPLLGLVTFLVYAPVSLVSLAWLIRRHRIDVINCHYLAPSFLHLALASRFTRVPLVLSVHGADVDAYGQASPLHRLMLRLIVRSADSVVACSEALARQTTRAFPQARDKATWVHNGLDLTRYEPGLGNVTVPEPFILCVCRHVQKKGVDTLLDAFAHIAATMRNWSLVLVGDGPLLSAHKAQAERLEIAGRVRFLGDVPHAKVSSIIERCGIFVLPSRAEPFGIVLLEAASYSKPIVCTRVGGVPEIITHDRDGLLVEPDDVAEMAAAILAVLRDDDRAARLGAEARRTLKARFLWKDRIEDYIAVYQGVPRHSQDAHPGGLAVLTGWIAGK